jgi:hypothetical protein
LKPLGILRHRQENDIKRNGRIILKGHLKTCGIWSRVNLLRTRPSGGLLNLGFQIEVERSDYLGNYTFIKHKSVTGS